MQQLKSLRNVLLATSALVLLAACASDGTGSSLGGGGSGGGASSSSVPQLGVTGTGGATSALGVSALTDPILGTGGVLGGGSNGELGSQIPADQLKPLSSQLAPVAAQIASALPLSTVTSQLPDLGVAGTGGLLDDVAGQDPLTGIVGTNGVVGTLVGGGNSGALGNVVPAGSVPSLPGLPGGLPSGLPSGLALPGGDPTAVITSLAGGLTSGTGQTALTNIVSAGTSNPNGTVQGLLTSVSGVAGGAGGVGGAGGASAVSGLGNTVSSVLPAPVATPVKGALTQVSTALAPVTSALP
ncbi:MAG: hypothetical protein P4L72_06060 [Parvibaculum sp.]|uniref:hypothetical protein n=1 Tax=Parvibaculum sp. TaxID=2024848 RepID=UPI0028489978|nr:hypothetical protein [Parvibaculum sp.]MDR3498773.1 hypothetical protein [Parvibaculum sp.]